MRLSSFSCKNNLYEGCTPYDEDYEEEYDEYEDEVQEMDGFPFGGSDEDEEEEELLAS